MWSASHPFAGRVLGQDGNSPCEGIVGKTRFSFEHDMYLHEKVPYALKMFSLLAGACEQ